MFNIFDYVNVYVYLFDLFVLYGVIFYFQIYNEVLIVFFNVRVSDVLCYIL